jgi:hypothetical protein
MRTTKQTTITRTKLPTIGTDLGSIVRSNFNKFNSLSFSFVLDKTLQLEETPIANPIVHSLSSIEISNSLEVFHHNFVSIKFGNNCLADVMIYPLHKPFLSTRDFSQQSLCRPCAFALEFTSQEFEFSFNLFDLGGIKELPVGSDSEIINPQVHTESSVRTRTDGAFLGERKMKEAKIISSEKGKFLTEAEFWKEVPKLKTRQTKPDRVKSDKCRSNVADVQRENAIRRDKTGEILHIKNWLQKWVINKDESSGWRALMENDLWKKEREK